MSGRGRPLPPPAPPRPPTPPGSDAGSEPGEDLCTDEATKPAHVHGSWAKPGACAKPVPHDWLDVIGIPEGDPVRWSKQQASLVRDPGGKQDAEVGDGAGFEDEPLSPDVPGRVEELTSAWPCEVMALCPVCWVLVSTLACLLGCCGALIHRPVVETSFDSFLKADVNASVSWDNFLAARAQRPTVGRRLSDAVGDTSTVQKDLVFAYELGETLEGGMLHRRALGAVADFERRVRGKEAWQRLCGQTAEATRSLCEPGLSLANYAKPTLGIDGAASGVVPEELLLDGGRGRPLPFAATRAVLDRAHGDLQALLLPEGFDADSEPPSVQRIRSVFRFSFPCCAAGAPSADEVDDRWEDFFFGTVRPTAEEAAEEEDLLADVRIYFDGSDIEDFEIIEALRGDTVFALGSLVFVHVYLYMHTRSLLLCLAGPILAGLSLPLAYSTSAMLFGITEVSFAAFVALFLVIGFGADVMLVYTEFWGSSTSGGRWKLDVGRDADQAIRLTWTSWNAGVSTLATTCTTSLSFFSNLASSIRGVRQFGFMMGCCIFYAWLLISVIYLPLILVSELYCPKRPHCFRGGCRRRRAGQAGAASQAARPEEADARQGLSGKILGQGLRWLWAGRRAWLALSAAAALIGGVLAAAQVKVNLGSPSIFPEDHNRHTVEDIVSRFATLKSAMPSEFLPLDTSMAVCNAGKLESFAQETRCPLLWCSAQEWSGASGGCSCMRKDNCNENHSDIFVDQYFVLDDSSILGDSGTPGWLLDYIGGELGLGGAPTAHSAAPPRDLKVVMQEWVTGDIEMRDAKHIRTDVARPDGDESCGWVETCFCAGPTMCSRQQALDAGWSAATGPDLSAAASRRAAAGGAARGAAAAAPTVAAGRPGRGLSAPAECPTEERAYVRVLFGIWVSETTPLLGTIDSSQGVGWGYRGHFDPTSWQAQRDLRAFCSDMDRAQLQVTRSWCWIDDFKDWLEGEGLQFPLREETAFHRTVIKFADEDPVDRYGVLWVRGFQVKGMFFSFETCRPDSVSDMSDLMEKWAYYVEGWNTEAREEVRGARDLSLMWIAVESAGELYRSTAITFAVLLGVGFLGMAVFTRSGTLSLLVVLATVAVISALFFFVVVCMGWEVGLIEVIALIYFIGYSLTYSLHIAHKYASRMALVDERRPAGVPRREDAVRLRRTRYAVKAIGGATLGSAITTVGASAFLLPCTLVIFRKLGAMCLAVTLTSICVALCPLPAALMLFGPLRPGAAAISLRQWLGRTASGLCSSGGSQLSPRSARMPG